MASDNVHTMTAQELEDMVQRARAEGKQESDEENRYVNTVLDNIETELRKLGLYGKLPATCSAQFTIKSKVYEV